MAGNVERGQALVRKNVPVQCLEKRKKSDVMQQKLNVVN